MIELDTPVEENDYEIAVLSGLPHRLQKIVAVPAAKYTGGSIRRALRIRIVQPLDLGSSHKSDLHIVDDVVHGPAGLLQISAGSHIGDAIELDACASVSIVSRKAVSP